MRIEVFTKIDTEDLTELGEAFAKEFNETFDPEHFKASWNELQNLDVTINILLYNSKGQVVGCLLSYLAYPMYVKEEYIRECFWYVLPKYRRYGIQLIKRLIHIFNSNPQIKELHINPATKYRNEKMNSVLSKLGFSKIEELFSIRRS